MFHLVLTRGHTGLTVTQGALLLLLLLKDADVLGLGQESAASITQQQNAEQVTRLLSGLN